ncbi:MAG: type II toxin-antitoxin system VapC family toxin [Methanoregula sp.]|nr:type II toxin-antitoxin system VapC family toxin [Methanoregula sp.]
MNNFSSCVIDTSVIIKALFSPSHSHAGKTYSRELKTHKSCVALLAVLDDHGIEVFLPRCGIIEIAAVSTRLANPSVSEEICNEVETSFTIVPEDRLIESAKKIALNEGCPGFDTYFIALSELNSIPLFTDDLGMHRICERRTIRSWLLRDIDLKSIIPDLK